MAFEQGFYNLFLALGIIVGLVIGGAAGDVIVVFACLSIVGAAFVLATGGSKYFRAALMQGITPAIALAVALIARTARRYGRGATRGEVARAPRRAEVRWSRRRFRRAAPRCRRVR